MKPKPLQELSAGTLTQYRHRLKALWLREKAGYASPQDVQVRKALEKRLGITASALPPQGRPRVSKA
jgi:hypothetical protein